MLVEIERLFIHDATMRAFGPVSYLFLAESCGQPDPQLRLASTPFREGTLPFLALAIAGKWA
jgi:hypothetical protein